MKVKTECKINRIREYFIERDVFFTEHAHGQFKVDGVSFWATTEKWYDPHNQVKNVGLRSFSVYMKL